MCSHCSFHELWINKNYLMLTTNSNPVWKHETWPAVFSVLFLMQTSLMLTQSLKTCDAMLIKKETSSSQIWGESGWQFRQTFLEVGWPFWTIMHPSLLQSHGASSVRELLTWRTLLSVHMKKRTLDLAKQKHTVHADILICDTSYMFLNV